MIKKEERKLVGLVRHFKYEILTDEEKKQNKYVYQILAEATHTETKEQVVVYQAMYGDFKVYVRPKDMFYSEVDRQKYPNIRQKYRFENYLSGTEE